MQRSLQNALPHAVQVSAYGCTELGGIISQNDPSGDARAAGDEMRHPVSRDRGPHRRSRDRPGPRPPVRSGESWPAASGCSRATTTIPCAPPRRSIADGWFHTGDIGSVDDGGRIAYHGRTKDMLKVGGENVAALEVESYLSRHPAVRLAQVVSIPDARLDEVPAAFVELEPGHEVTEEELIAFCRGQIASFKIPRHVRFVSAWPMSATKIQKFKLREELLAELDQHRALTVILAISRIF